MSTKYYLNWEEDDSLWESEDRLWEDISIIIGEVANIGAGRNPYEDAEIKRQLGLLNKVKTDKLIQVMIFLGNEEFIEKKKKNENITIQVDDVKTIARNYLKIEID